MAKVSGIKNVARKLEEIQEAIAALDGELAVVSFDPEDAQSVNLAIRQMETSVDERLAKWRHNSSVVAIGEKTKNSLRERILDRVKSKREEEGLGPEI